jgi:Tat protein translocase TatB subunit
MNLFGIGYLEVAVILVAALIIFGPQRLPEVAGQAARWLRDARKMLTDMSSEFEKSAGVKEFKDAIEGEIKGVKKELEDAGLAVKKDLNAAAGTANKAVNSAANAAKGTKAKSGTSSTNATSTKPAATTASAVKNAKPKATKSDPFAGLVQMTEVTPKAPRVAAASSNGSAEPVPVNGSPTRETSEAVMRARERRINAGYNRRMAAS